MNRSTNTARLLGLTLSRFELRTRGSVDERERPTVAGELPADARLLYPAPGARLLELASDLAQMTLVVPDGTWRQTLKLVRRDPRLLALPKVQLPPATSIYRLRAQPSPGLVCTFEAVARALGIVEGRAIEAVLMSVFCKTVERTLWSRGQLPASQVTGGIPAAAIEADRAAGRRGQLIRKGIARF